MALGETGEPRATRHLIRALQDDGPTVRAAAARALGVLGDPSAIMPLYEIASDRSIDYDFRQIAVRSLEQLGFTQREEGGPPAILAWAGGVVVIGASLLLATAIGPLALLPLLAGVAIIFAYYVREARKSRGDWYVGADGGEFWIPGDVGDGGGWLGDLFGGGNGGGGGGNGGGGS